LDRLNKYCDALIESSWLLALIVTPLFFMMDSFRISDAPKIYIFRSIIFLGLAAWAFKGIFLARLRGFNQVNLLKQFRERPVLVPVAALLAVYLISTIFSISPRTSLMGSYFRVEGTITLSTYLVLFLIILFNLHTPEQFDRFVAVLAIVSLTVDSYALLQHYHLDPYYWPNIESSSRVISTIGHPIFTAAFLSMAIFIFIPRVIISFQAFYLKQKSRGGDLIRALLYSLICLLNLACIWFTVSRGPLLGLLSGLAFFLLLILLYWRLRRVLYGLLILGAVMLSLLITLNIPSGPLAFLRDSPMVGPLGHLFDAETGTGQTRVLIWQGMARLNAPHAPLPFPDQTSDGWNAIRWLVGYGPDVLHLAYEGYYDPQVFILESPNVAYDRSHNRFWDILGFSGLLGLLAEYGLTLSLFYYALHWMRLVRSGLEKKLFWILSIGGGLAGSLIALVVSRPEYIGPAAHLGMLAGLVGVLTFRIFRPGADETPHPQAWRAITMIGLLAALISNYVELSTGIVTITSSLLFWSFSALLFVLGADWNEAQEAAGAQASLTQGLRSIGVNSTILVLLVVTIGSRFLVNPQLGPDAATILTNALTSISSPSPQVSFGVLSMLVGSLVAGSLLLQLEHDARRGQAPDWKNIFATAGLTLIGSTLILLLRASQLAGVDQSAAGGDTRALVDGWNGLTAGVFIVLFLFFLLLAFVLTSSARRGLTRAPTNPALVYLGLFFCFSVALIGVVVLNLRPLQADVLYTKAWTRTDASAALIYAEMLALAPEQQEYQRFADKLYNDRIASTANINEKEAYYQTGLEHIKAANALEPLLISNVMALAEFYQVGGDISPDPAQKNARFFLANTYYAAALKIKTTRVDYWLQWAGFCALKGDLPCALDKVASAQKVDSASDKTYQFLGDLYSLYAGSLTDPGAQRDAYTKALQAYQIQADLLTRKGANPAVAFFGIGNVYEALTQYGQARAAFLQAAQLGSAQNQWQIYERIAVMSSFLKEPATQREYLQKALDLAPQDQKARLRDELNKLAP
jgi:hypothetical protein